MRGVKQWLDGLPFKPTALNAAIAGAAAVFLLWAAIQIPVLFVVIAVIGILAAVAKRDWP